MTDYKRISVRVSSLLALFCAVSPVLIRAADDGTGRVRYPTLPPCYGTYGQDGPAENNDLKMAFALLVGAQRADEQQRARDEAASLGNGSTVPSAPPMPLEEQTAKEQASPRSRQRPPLPFLMPGAGGGAATLQPFPCATYGGVPTIDEEGPASPEQRRSGSNSPSSRPGSPVQEEDGAAGGSGSSGGSSRSPRIRDNKEAPPHDLVGTPVHQGGSSWLGGVTGGLSTAYEVTLPVAQTVYSTVAPVVQRAAALAAGGLGKAWHCYQTAEEIPRLHRAVALNDNPKKKDVEELRRRIGETRTDYKLVALCGLVGGHISHRNARQTGAVDERPIGVQAAEICDWIGAQELSRKAELLRTFSRTGRLQLLDQRKGIEELRAQLQLLEFQAARFQDQIDMTDALLAVLPAARERAEQAGRAALSGGADDPAAGGAEHQGALSEKKEGPEGDE